MRQAVLGPGLFGDAVEHGSDACPGLKRRPESTSSQPGIRGIGRPISKARRQGSGQQLRSGRQLRAVSSAAARFRDRQLGMDVEARLAIVKTLVAGSARLRAVQAWY